MADDITLKIAYDVASATRALSGLEKQSVKSVTAISKAFDGLKTVAGAALAFVAGRAVVGFFQDGIQSAIQQEQALARLNLQLEATGEGGEAASNQFAKLADELEATTKFQDDAVISAAALAKAYGLTNAQAIDLTKASADLASATGDSLEGAVQSLTNSYSGNIRGLGRLIPELRTLTKEQLASGEAVRIVAERFRGAATGEVQTYQGALIKLDNAFSNLAESLGAVVVENKTLQTFILGIGQAISVLQQQTDKNKSALTQVLDFGIRATATIAAVSLDIVRAVTNTATLLIQGVLSLLARALKAIEVLGSALGKSPLAKLKNVLGNFRGAAETAFQSFSNLADENVTVPLDNAQKAIDDFSVSLFAAGEAGSKAGSKISGGVNGLRGGLAETAEQLEQMKKSAEDFVKAIGTDAADEYLKIERAFDENSKRAEEFYRKGLISDAQFQRAQVDNAEARNRKLGELDKKRSDDAKRINDDTLAAQEKAEKEAFDRRKARIEELNKLAGVFASGIAGGADGAKGFVTGIAATAGDLVIPGLGSALKPLLDLFAQGPEQTKAQVKAFVEAVPDIVVAIAESAPVFVDALIKSLIDDGGIVKIAEALARASLESFLKIGFEAPAKAFGRLLGVEVGSAFTGSVLGGKIRAAFVRAAGGITEVFNRFGESLRNGINQAFLQGLQNLVGGTLQFFERIGEQLSNLATAIGEKLLEFVTKLPLEIIKGVTDLIDGFVEGFREKFEEILSFEPPWLEKLREILNSANPGARGGAIDRLTGGRASSVISTVGAGIVGGPTGAFVEGVRQVLGFANGGISRGPDTQLALTRPDEMLLNPRQQMNLFNQLNGGTGLTGNEALPLLVKIANLLEQGTRVETSINIGPDRLATAILNLNRRNARLGV